MHGTVQDYWHGCRCLLCRAAYSKYWREGHARRKAGRKAFVDSGWAARQIAESESLRDAGKRLGLSYQTIRRIRAGKRITETTERIILKA